MGESWRDAMPFSVCDPCNDNDGGTCEREGGNRWALTCMDLVDAYATGFERGREAGVHMCRRPALRRYEWRDTDYGPQLWDLARACWVLWYGMGAIGISDHVKAEIDSALNPCWGAGDELTQAYREERDAARATASILAHAYRSDNRPPPRVVRDALSYPVDPGGDRTEQPEAALNASVTDSDGTRRYLVTEVNRLCDRVLWCQSSRRGGDLDADLDALEEQRRTVERILVSLEGRDE